MSRAYVASTRKFCLTSHRHPPISVVRASVPVPLPQSRAQTHNQVGPLHLADPILQRRRHLVARNAGPGQHDEYVARALCFAGCKVGHQYQFTFAEALPLGEAMCTHEPMAGVTAASW